MPKKLGLLIVFLVLFSGGYFYYTKVSTTTPPVLDLDVSDFGSVEDDSSTNFENGLRGPTQQEIKDNTFNYPTERSIELTDVTGGSSSGTTYNAYSIDDKDIFLYTEANLPPLEGDNFYEGWIVGDPSIGEVISTGELEEVNGTYFNYFYLTYTEEDTVLNRYENVVITLETIRDEIPEAHVLEGSFDNTP